MANYREDIVNIDLENGNINRTYLKHSIGYGDNNANKFGVRVFRNGEAETLLGSCYGLFIRADGATIIVNTGAVSGNLALVTLPEACYAVEGVFTLAIKVTAEEDVTTLRIVDGMVDRTRTDAVVDPGTLIPSIDDLMAAIEEAVESIPSDYSELSDDVGHMKDDYLTEGNFSFLSLANDFTYLDNTNTEQENSVVSVTDYIRIPNDATYVQASTKTYYNGSETYIAPLVFFFDKNKNYISRASDQTNDIASVAIPQNAKYVRINQPASSVSQEILRLIRFVYGSMGYHSILTSDDDANDIIKPGMYWFGYNSKPAHLPDEITESGRILVIKSEGEENFGAEWQLICNFDGFFFRSSQYTSGRVWSEWNRVQRMKSALGFKKELTAADSMRAITENGLYYYGENDMPEDAPTIFGGRPIVVKSTTDSSHQYETQMQVVDGVFYYRGTKHGSSVLQPWKSLGLGSPMYQTETLPYDAVHYHAKWADWTTGYSRVCKTTLLGNVDNDQNLPIYMYQLSLSRNFIDGAGDIKDYNFTNPPYPRPKFLIIGGQHGNEKCTPMDIWRIAQALKSRDYNDIACKFDWYFIPLVNPWGYSHAHLDSNGNIIYGNDTENVAQTVACTEEINAGIRNNGHDMNLNRDWSDNTYSLSGMTYGFQTPELQIVKPVIDSIVPDVFIDAHQNHADPGFSTDPMTCYCRHYYINPDAESLKVDRRMDVANANTDQIMHRYHKNTRTVHQTCRYAMEFEGAETNAMANLYMGGGHFIRGGVDRGNTSHPELATKYAILTETSEICYSFNGGSNEWYNPIACTFSCTYLWEMIKQIADLF